MYGIFGWIARNGEGHRAEHYSHITRKLAGENDGITSFGDSHAFAYLSSRGSIHVDPDSKTAVVCDGYLEWKNLQFREYQSRFGDSAAILFAYQKHREDFVKHVHGSFALVLSDPGSNQVFLAVDRFGIQRLCYSFGKKGTTFSSDLENLVSGYSTEVELDRQSIFNYVFHQFIPSPRTIYQNISKVEPATMVIINNGVATSYRYWIPHFVGNRSSRMSRNKEQDTLLQKLESATAKYSSERNIGTFLSGGLDSSTVTGMLSRHNEEPIDTYTIGFAEEGYDETEYARIVSKHFSTRAHEYYVTPSDIVSAIPEVAKSYDEPFGNSSAIPALLCARMAKEQGTDTLLAGDGGDELFAGNERYAKQLLLGVYSRLPKKLRRSVLEPLFLDLGFIKKNPLTRKISSYINQASQPVINRISEESYNFFQGALASDIFTEGFLSQVDINCPLNDMTFTFDSIDTESLLDRMLYLDWKYTLADNDLRKVNRMCELGGVEVLYPMLDDDLVEYSTTIPSSLKLRDRNLRYLFREAVNGFLPEEIIEKGKHGFGLPFGNWLKTDASLSTMTHSDLTALKTRGIVESDYIDTVLALHQSGHSSYYGSVIWSLVMLEEWLRAHHPSTKI